MNKAGLLYTYKSLKQIVEVMDRYGSKVVTSAEEGQELFMAAILAFHTGKAVVQIAAVEAAVNDLLQIGPPESVLP